MHMQRHSKIFQRYLCSNVALFTDIFPATPLFSDHEIIISRAVESIDNIFQSKYYVSNTTLIMLWPDIQLITVPLLWKQSRCSQMQKTRR